MDSMAWTQVMGQQRRGMRWWRRGPHREVGAHDALQGRVVDGAERRVEAKLRWQHAERVDAWQTDPSASFQHVRPDAAARGHASQGQRTVAGVRVADGDVVVAHRLRGRRLHLPDQQCFLRAVAGGAATATSAATGLNVTISSFSASLGTDSITLTGGTTGGSSSTGQ